MHREGHHGLNALLYAPVALAVTLFGSLELAVIGAVFAVGTASLPDFDRHFDNNMNTHRSGLWTLVPIKHRGFTHTVWFAVLGGVVGGGFGTIAVQMVPQHTPAVVAGFAGVMTTCGILGHILGDMMTPMGVKPFSPLRKKTYSLAWFLAKSRVANYGFLFLGGTALLLAFGYGFSEVGINLDSYAASLAPVSVFGVIWNGWTD